MCQQNKFDIFVIGNIQNKMHLVIAHDKPDLFIYQKKHVWFQLYLRDIPHITNFKNPKTPKNISV